MWGDAMSDAQAAVLSMQGHHYLGQLRELLTAEEGEVYEGRSWGKYQALLADMDAVEGGPQLMAQAQARFWSMVELGGSLDGLARRAASLFHGTFDDALQEARIGAFQGGVTWRPQGGSTWRSWKRRAAANQLEQWGRVQGGVMKVPRGHCWNGLVPIPDDEQREPIDEGGPDILELIDGRHLRSLLGQLEPELRQTLQLRYGLLDGEALPKTDVARRMCCHRDTVATRERRALDELRRLIARREVADVA